MSKVENLKINLDDKTNKVIIDNKEGICFDIPKHIFIFAFQEPLFQAIVNKITSTFRFEEIYISGTMYEYIKTVYPNKIISPDTKIIIEYNVSIDDILCENKASLKINIRAGFIENLYSEFEFIDLPESIETEIDLERIIKMKMKLAN